MQALEPVTLEGYGVRLEPMTEAHKDELLEAAADGELWKLWYTSVPGPDGPIRVEDYVAAALAGLGNGTMLPGVFRSES